MVNECSLRCSLKNHRLHVPGQAQHRLPRTVSISIKQTRTSIFCRMHPVQTLDLPMRLGGDIPHLFFQKVVSLQLRLDGRQTTGDHGFPHSYHQPVHRHPVTVPVCTRRTYLVGGTSSPMVIPRMGGFSFTVSQSMIFDHHCQQNMLRIASRRVTNTKISKSQ